MLKKAVAFTLILFLIILILPPPTTAQSYEGRGIRIKCRPESVSMSPGETRSIQIHISNLSNNTLYIGLDYTSIEGIGATSGRVSDDYFPLQPNTTHLAILKLTASPGWFHSEHVNDGVLEVTWGHEDQAQPINPVINFLNPRNFTTINIEVTKDMTMPTVIFGIVFSISVIFIAMAIIKHQKKKEN